MDELSEVMTVRMPEELRAKIEEEAKRRHLRMADVVRDAVRGYFKEQDAPKEVAS